MGNRICAVMLREKAEWRRICRVLRHTAARLDGRLVEKLHDRAELHRRRYAHLASRVAAAEWRANPVIAEEIRGKSPREIAKVTMTRFGAAADLSLSRSTESAYVIFPHGGEIRLSYHQAYRSNQPCHVLVGRVGAEELAYRLDRAVRAALVKTRSYAQVPTWGEIAAN